MSCWISKRKRSFYSIEKTRKAFKTSKFLPPPTVGRTCNLIIDVASIQPVLNANCFPTMDNRPWTIRRQEISGGIDIEHYRFRCQKKRPSLWLSANLFSRVYVAQQYSRTDNGVGRYRPSVTRRIRSYLFFALARAFRMNVRPFPTHWHTYYVVAKQRGLYSRWIVP